MRWFGVRMLAVYLGFALFLGCSEAPREVALDTEMVADGIGSELDRAATRFADYGFSGCVLVAHGEEVLLHKAYGSADLDSGRPNTVDLRFPALSVTQPFVAMALLQQEERGALEIDEPLETYLGTFPEEKRAATLHHLLTHTAGLSTRDTYVAGPDRAEFVQAMKDAPMDSEPGSKRRFSNVGYSLATAVLEEVTGQPWTDVIRQQIFEPAGMTQTGFWGEFPPESMTMGHAGPAWGLRPVDLSVAPPELSQMYWGGAGAAGIVTTVADLYRWIRATASGDLLSPSSLQRMFTAYVDDQGYGWHVDTTSDGRPRRWMAGGLPEYEVLVAWYPDEDFLIAFVVNNWLGWRTPLWTAVENVLYGRAIDLPPAAVPMETAAVTAPDGRYRLASGGELEVKEESDRLVLTAEDPEGAAALGFEEELSKPGVALVARPTGPRAFTGIHIRGGRAALPVVGLQFTDEQQPTLSLQLPDGSSVEARAVEAEP